MAQAPKRAHPRARRQRPVIQRRSWRCSTIAARSSCACRVYQELLDQALPAQRPEHVPGAAALHLHTRQTCLTCGSIRKLCRDNRHVPDPSLRWTANSVFGEVNAMTAGKAGLLVERAVNARTTSARRACSWMTGEASAEVNTLAPRALGDCSSSAATSAGLGRLRPSSPPNTCAPGLASGQRRFHDKAVSHVNWSCVAPHVYARSCKSCRLPTQ